MMFSWEIYEMFQKQSPEVFYEKKLFLNISEYSQESCRPETLSKRDPNTGVFL